MLLRDTYSMDLAGARGLIARHGRATIVTLGPEGLKATYGYCLLEPENGPDITIVGHIARADPQSSDLIAGCETLLIFDGPHGYVSASWYAPTLRHVPSTWNYSAVHLTGIPEVLDADDTFALLRRTLEWHESALPEEDRWSLDDDKALEFARRIAPGTCAFRLHASKMEAKAKLSQDMPAAVIEQITARLAEPGPYQHPDLAASMIRLNNGWETNGATTD